MIGPGRDAHDIYDDWARAREVEESGCVLVRPDAHVAWRRAAVADDCAAELRARRWSRSSTGAESSREGRYTERRLGP